MGDKGKIVLIEDDEGVNEAMQMMLINAGYAVAGFLTVARSEISEAKDADLFIIDRNLKDVDGLELCRQIKSDQAMRRIPVLVISAAGETRDTAAHAGADRFLEKPFSTKQLLPLVEELINTR